MPQCKLQRPRRQWAFRESACLTALRPAVTSDSCQLAVVTLDFVSFRVKNSNNTLRRNTSKTESAVIILADARSFLSIVSSVTFCLEDVGGETV